MSVCVAPVLFGHGATRLSLQSSLGMGRRRATPVREWGDGCRSNPIQEWSDEAVALDLFGNGATKLSRQSFLGMGRRRSSLLSALVTESDRNFGRRRMTMLNLSHFSLVERYDQQSA
jgi:hypothetical protein